MTRHESREHIFRMLFRRDFYAADEWREQAERYLNSLEEQEGRQLSEEDKQALLDKTLAVCDKAADLDERIDEAAEGWKTKRMGKVDLTVLRLALYEMAYDEEVPTKVAINEAVEIARKFGGDESPSFVNGVLARLVDRDPV